MKTRPTTEPRKMSISRPQHLLPLPLPLPLPLFPTLPSSFPPFLPSLLPWGFLKTLKDALLQQAAEPATADAFSPAVAHAPRRMKTNVCDLSWIFPSNQPFTIFHGNSHLNRFQMDAYLIFLLDFGLDSKKFARYFQLNFWEIDLPLVSLSG